MLVAPTYMRVLFLTSFYPSTDDPAKGVFIRKHAKAAAINHQVTVINPVGTNNIDGICNVVILGKSPLQEITIYYNTRFINLPVLKNIFAFIGFFWGIINRIRMLEKVDGKFDIIHLHVSLPSGIIALYLHYVKRRNYILTEHGSNLLVNNFNKLSFFNRFLIRLIIRKSSITTAVSQYQAEEMVAARLKDKVYILSNIVEAHEQIRTHLHPHQPIQLIHVSNLAAVKQVNGILEALKSLNKTSQAAILHIVGGSPEAIAHYQSLAKKIGIAGDVVFHGWKPGNDVLSMMKTMDVFILNSKHETFCVVAAEAISCGIPVVSPDIPALRELVDEQSGLLFKYNSAIADTILETCRRYSHYNPETMKQSMTQRFSEEQLASDIQKLYTSPQELRVIKG